MCNLERIINIKTKYIEKFMKEDFASVSFSLLLYIFESFRFFLSLDKELRIHDTSGNPVQSLKFSLQFEKLNS